MPVYGCESCQCQRIGKNVFLQRMLRVSLRNRIRSDINRQNLRVEGVLDATERCHRGAWMEDVDGMICDRNPRIVWRLVRGE